MWCSALGRISVLSETSRTPWCLTSTSHQRLSLPLSPPRLPLSCFIRTCYQSKGLPVSSKKPSSSLKLIAINGYRLAVSPFESLARARGKRQSLVSSLFDAASEAESALFPTHLEILCLGVFTLLSAQLVDLTWKVSAKWCQLPAPAPTRKIYRHD